MSDEQDTGNVEFQRTPSEQNHNATNSQLSETAATITTQSDRIEYPQAATNRPGRASNEGNLPPPIHEDLDTIVDNCRRGRTTKTAATKDLLESVERLTHLSAQTREKTFISYIAEISSIDQEIVERGSVAGPTPGTDTNTIVLGPSSGQEQGDVERGDEFEERETPRN